MKKTITLLLMLVTMMSAAAQSQHSDDIKQRLKEVKVQELVYRLKITDQQKVKFMPIYERYSAEMYKVMGERQRTTRPQTSEATAQEMKRRMERQQQGQAVRMKYIDEFAQVLTPEQLDKLYKAEDRIQQKLKARAHHKKGKHAGQKSRKESRKQRGETN
ncbi:MAG: Spy/CpxP family protein refolding chaperone [Muribaculaceae bacterium]|nr:Spy/CpxP family protein refolding chaperone [Muribaculaceae bacterium]